MATIKQRNLKDCGICSLAMFLEKSYAEINRDVRSYHAFKYPDEKFNGICAEIENAVLWKHGVKFNVFCDVDMSLKAWMKRNVIFRKENGNWAIKHPEPPARSNLKKVVGKKKALISVPSINFKDKGHLIFWDGKKLHDPSNLKRYTPSRAFKQAYRVVVSA